MYFWIVKALNSGKATEFYQREGEEEARTKWQTSMRLTRYPLIFVVLWIFPIINRIQNWIAGDDGVFFLVLLHSISVSIQGTINGIIYCRDEQILHHCTPGGAKAAFVKLASPRRRREQEVQKYSLGSEEGESEASLVPHEELEDKDTLLMQNL